MARHGENIRKRKDGRWEGRYPVYCETKGKKVYQSVYGRTYSEAKEKLAVQKILVTERKPEETGGKDPSDVPDVLLKDIAEEWLAEMKTKRKLSTYTKYSFIYHNHIEETFRGTALSSISNTLVQEKVSGCLSESTQRDIYCVLTQILKFASGRYCVTMLNVKRPATRRNKKPIEIFTQTELTMLLRVLYQEMTRFKMAVLLCLYTGLRLGELCAMKWTDIDMESGLMTVSRTVQRLYVDGHRTKTVLVETVPKSEYSKREIPLPDVVLELLVKYKNDTEYVFGGEKPMEPRTLQYHFKKILREAKLPGKNFHILRHTFATNCIAGGTDVKSLSEILGHADVQITLKRYVHPSMDTKRKHLDMLSKFYGQIYGLPD